MDEVVASWLDKVAGVLAGGARGSEEVRRALDRARRDRARIQLQPLSANTIAEAGTSRATVMATTIEQLRDDDMIVAQPTIGGFCRRLATNERLLIQFPANGGVLFGETRALGREQVPAGAGGILYGYRLGIPRHLVLDRPPERERVRIAIDLAPKVELIPIRPRNAEGGEREPFKLAPLRGIGDELDSESMLIRIRGFSDRLTAGQRAHLRVTLPDPVGAVDTLVTVSRIAPGAHEDERLVLVQFSHELSGMRELLQQLSQKRRERNREE